MAGKALFVRVCLRQHMSETKSSNRTHELMKEGKRNGIPTWTVSSQCFVRYMYASHVDDIDDIGQKWR